MAVDPILITSDLASRVSMLTYKQRVTQAKVPKGDRKARPFLRFCESIKKSTGVSGEDGAKFGHIQFSPGLSASWIRDEDTIQAAQQVNHMLRWETGYARATMPVKIVHDEWLRKGYRIVPHDSGMPVKITDAQYSKLKEDLWDNVLEAATDDLDKIIDIAIHRQGGSSKEIGGLNMHLPIVQQGLWSGHNRQDQPLVRHIVKKATVGAGGTLRKVLRQTFRELAQVKATCDLPAGEFFLMAGGDFIDAYIDECERQNVQYQADLSGVQKMDGVILDDAVRIGRQNCFYNPTLDLMNTMATSELGVSISPVTATFSGGGATLQATGLVYVNAAGQIAAIVVTDPGAGYTSAPTVTLGNVGAGAGATFQAKVYSANSGAGLIQVAADDNRIGRLATVTVLGGGTNYTVGDQPLFSKRLYILYKPSWNFEVIKGMDRELVKPADPARSRVSELQFDWGGYFYNTLPGANAVIYLP